ncbi:hypothetical protein NQZ68_006043 [Dissostichus eleginoides]|nr:hypothetical protein NQZ68_006043 [Dissostichus eleginoides]
MSAKTVLSSQGGLQESTTTDPFYKNLCPCSPSVQLIVFCSISGQALAVENKSVVV